MNIDKHLVHCILITNESSIDILYFDTFEKIRLSPSRLGRVEAPLIDFTGDAIPVKGVITLTIKVGQYPRQSTTQIDFLIIQGPSAYNTILE